MIAFVWWKQTSKYTTINFSKYMGEREGEGGGGQYSPNFWVGVCRTVLKTLTLFQTEIYDFSYLFITLFRLDPKNLYPQRHKTDHSTLSDNLLNSVSPWAQTSQSFYLSEHFPYKFKCRHHRYLFMSFIFCFMSSLHSLKSIWEVSWHYSNRCLLT